MKKIGNILKTKKIMSYELFIKINSYFIIIITITQYNDYVAININLEKILKFWILPIYSSSSSLSDSSLFSKASTKLTLVTSSMFSQMSLAILNLAKVISM